MGVRAVFLVGFMASGKSTVGPELARRLGWTFIDLDSHIEFREKQSIPEIFRNRGEDGFRAAETAALHNLIQDLEQDSIVALGGGAFAQAANRDLLSNRHTVFLEAPLDELWRRSQEDGIERPLRRDRAQFAQLYSQRLPFYRQAAVTVDTSGKNPAAICEGIEGAFNLAPINTGGSR
jgi:shikimate kinase